MVWKEVWNTSSSAALSVLSGLMWNKEPHLDKDSPFLSTGFSRVALCRVLTFPLTLWMVLSYRGPPCCPAAAQVQGDRHDFC